ncbi:MAG: GAF domain-containing protein [Anaerolineae bacterium]
MGLVVLLVVILGIGVTLGGLQGLSQQARNQLASVAILKESEIETWLADLQFDLILALTGDEVQRRALTLLEGTGGPAAQRLAQSEVNMRLEQVIAQTGRHEALLLLNLQGQVVFSTDEAQQGAARGSQLYFREGLKGPYIQPPRHSVTDMSTFIYASRPVMDPQGQVVGVLAGRANLNTLNEIMAERTGLGDTGETYLVNSNQTMLTPARTGENNIWLGTDGVARAVGEQLNGSDLYDNYRQVAVVGAYRWLPDLQVALLAEQEQGEAFRPVYTMLGIAAGVGLLGLVLAVGVSLLMTRSIVTPLAGLAETAGQIADGNLMRVVPSGRRDEIGRLARAFNSMTAQLRELIGSLEDRVAERTAELERRSHYLEAAAEVGRAASSILESEALMDQVVNLIRDEFDLYYAGLFMLDDTGEWAVLRAGTEPGGQALLAREHRLRVGGESMIGWCTAQGQARVALEAGEDAVRLATPELPETRSEAALPLRSRGKVIGALTVQDDEPGAFDAQSMVVLQTMADQVAATLDNARLFSERLQALEMAQRAYGELSREAWVELLQAQPQLAFRSDMEGLHPAGDESWRPAAAEALRGGQTVVHDDSSPGDAGDGTEDQQVLAIPLRVRGEVIGVLDTYKPVEAGPWTAEEITLLERIVEEMDPALESARLYQDTQRRAARELAIRQVTERMRRAVDVEAILQNTVAELAKAMGAPRAYVRLGSPEILGTESQGEGKGQASGAGDVGSGRS